MSLTPSDDSSLSSGSTYPPLEKPDAFKSQIPDHLMIEASNAERFIMSQLSVLTQFADWSVKAHLSQDRQLRFTNGTVRRHTTEITTLQTDKQFVLTGWRAVVAAGGIVSGITAFVILIYKALSGG